MNGPESFQHAAWISGQAADAFFNRNRNKLDADLAPSRSTRALATHLRSTDRILEVGTANGRILEQLRRLTACDAYGTEPSPEAIADGLSRYPHLRLSVGSADNIDYADGFFNAVLLGFCLYLVDRALVMRVVSEVDRVLADGGRLMITDFDPPFPCRRPFAHQQGLWSYKMQYPGLWLANPAYVLEDKISFSHEGEAFHDDPDERVATWVIHKSIAGSYHTKD